MVSDTSRMQPKSIQRALGLMFNATDYICLGRLAQASMFEIELASEKIKYADRTGSKTIPVESSYRIQGTLKELTPGWISRFTAGSLATGGQIYYKETVTKSGATLTLTHGSGGTEGGLLILDVTDTTNKTQRKKVSASPVADDSYTLATKILTLHASDTGTTFEVTYIYTDSATADGKIIVPSQTFPGLCRILLACQMVNPNTGAVTYQVVDCAKCQPTGKMPFGGDVQKLLDTPITFDVMNEVDGDIVIYPNGYNPGF